MVTWALPALVFVALLQGARAESGDASAPSIAAGAAATTDSESAQLVKLKKQADQASASLAAATRRYEDDKGKVTLAVARVRRTRIDAGRAGQEYEKWRTKVAKFAVGAYGSPLPDDASVLMSSRNPDMAVQRATTLSVLTNSEEYAMRQATREKRRADSLARKARQLAKAASTERSNLSEQIAALRKKSADTTKALVKLVDRMSGGAASRDASRIILSLTCKQGATSDRVRNGDFANGLLPSWALCHLPGYAARVQLRADAAKAFVDLNAAYRAHFGKKMCITDSYRSLASQQRVYYQKPGLAAVPGTSNHGWGLALDLGCGVQTYGSPEFDWLKHHGGKYGWVHPSWAEHSPFEPWHFEYEPGTKTQPASGTADVGH
ncbi:MAG: M15 family metallopeptidase [Streptosporangiales bacterium]|nr:M15 family metallopeptidase [Streptosporangiales bacterium]MBO0890401.1 M15 family metallopeptidase [Acidothermales bacterium]